MGEISVRLPASRRAPVTPPPPRLTRPPPRPQMMPEGLVLVGVPQTLPPQPPQTPNLCVSQENLAVALRLDPPDGQGLRCPASSSHACASNSTLSHAPSPWCSQTQVAAQIKVRDLSRCTVTASPAGYSSWNEARSELCARRLDAALPPRARAHRPLCACRMIEQKKPLKVGIMSTSHANSLQLLNLALPLRAGPARLGALGRRQRRGEGVGPRRVRGPRAHPRARDRLHAARAVDGPPGQLQYAPPIRPLGPLCSRSPHPPLSTDFLSK